MILLHPQQIFVLLVSFFPLKVLLHIQMCFHSLMVYRVFLYTLINSWSRLGGVMGIWGMRGGRGESEVKGTADGCCRSSAQVDNRWKMASTPRA